MKYLIFISLLFLSCEKDESGPECKECTYIENNTPVKIFVCGDDLVKFENSGFPCVKIDCKN